MTYHLAPSLVQLRAEANAEWPGRSKASDGWIGDTAHGARKSDHNPAPPTGVVRALDLTNSGLDPDRLVAAACADPRTAYVISRGLIYTRENGFRPVRYTGANPHNHHAHISIRHGMAYETSTASWGLSSQRPSTGGSGASVAPAPTPPMSEEDTMSAAGEARIIELLEGITIDARDSVREGRARDKKIDGVVIDARDSALGARRLPGITIDARDSVLGNRQILAEVAGLRVAVAALASKAGLDPKAITAAVDAGVTSALGRVETTVTVKPEAGK